MHALSCADVWDQRQRFIATRNESRVVGSALAPVHAHCAIVPRWMDPVDRAPVQKRPRCSANAHSMEKTYTTWYTKRFRADPVRTEARRRTEHDARMLQAKEETTLTTVSIVQRCDSDACTIHGRISAIIIHSPPRRLGDLQRKTPRRVGCERKTCLNQMSMRNRTKESTNPAGRG